PSSLVVGGGFRYAVPTLQTGGVTRDGRHWRGTGLSRRRAGCRFYAIRGGAFLYRGTRLARRRGGQDREPEDRRSRPPAAARATRRRPLVFPPVQRKQEVSHAQSEIPARARDRQGAFKEGRHHGR